MTTVRIGDRGFRIGATYAPKRGQRKAYRRTFVRLDFESNGPPPWVVYSRIMPDGTTRTRRCGATAWLRWAGEEVTP